MEFSRFFDAEPIFNSKNEIVGYDKEYKADDFAEYFRRVLTDGLLNGGTNLQVYCDGTNMKVKVKPGFAWIKGYLYKIDVGGLELEHEAADIANDRIDRIVVRWDIKNRKISSLILKGTPSTTPTPPDIIRNDFIYDLALAQIRILKGKSFIQASQITDERLNTTVCGLVNSLIQADTTNIFNQFQAFLNEKKIEYPNQWNGWFSKTTKDYENDLIEFLDSLRNRLTTADVTYLDERISATEALMCMGGM